MAEDLVVETRSLTKVYRDFWGRKKKTALNALDLKIHRGEIFGLLGPNGSGKTTTIKLLLGLLFPTSGDAFVFGEPAAKVEKNERIGYLPEESYLYRFLNAEETLDFYGRLFNIAPEVRKARAAELIERVGLGSDKKRILKEYSKGMRQRIGLAQALINDPELVILDEPTSGLDPLGTRWMKDLILDLRAKGKTVLMCSHRLEDVQDVCDRIAILYNGDLQTLGKVSTLVEDAVRVEVRARGVKESAQLKADLEALFKKHGGTLETVGHPASTLEELFLRVIEESKARPGRRYLPPEDGKAAPAPQGQKKKAQSSSHTPWAVLERHGTRSVPTTERGSPRCRRRCSAFSNSTGASPGATGRSPGWCRRGCRTPAASRPSGCSCTSSTRCPSPPTSRSPSGCASRCRSGCWRWARSASPATRSCWSPSSCRPTRRSPAWP